MKPGDLLAGTAALPPTVALPPYLAAKLDELPEGAHWEVNEERGTADLVVDLTKVPRHLRRKALRRFPRVGEIPKSRARPKRPNSKRTRADEKEEAMSMEIIGHPWSNGRGGRNIVKRRTGNNLRVVATLNCSTEGCTNSDHINHRAVLPPELLDKRFKQKGWQLDPPVCPTCVQQPKEERMATHADTTPAAALAQAKVFKLLGEHFSDDKGRYNGGYSDERIAKETGCALVFVQQCRKECFGELKEDPAVAELRGDIAALESLITESTTNLQQQLASVKAKLAQVAK